MLDFVLKIWRVSEWSIEDWGRGLRDIKIDILFLLLGCFCLEGLEWLG